MTVTDIEDWYQEGQKINLVWSFRCATPVAHTVMQIGNSVLILAQTHLFLI